MAFERLTSNQAADHTGGGARVAGIEYGAGWLERKKPFASDGNGAVVILDFDSELSEDIESSATVIAGSKVLDGGPTATEGS